MQSVADIRGQSQRGEADGGKAVVKMAVAAPAGGGGKAAKPPVPPEERLD